MDNRIAADRFEKKKKGRRWICSVIILSCGRWYKEETEWKESLHWTERELTAHTYLYSGVKGVKGEKKSEKMKKFEGKRRRRKKK